MLKIWILIILTLNLYCNLLINNIKRNSRNLGEIKQINKNLSVESNNINQEDNFFILNKELNIIDENLFDYINNNNKLKNNLINETDQLKKDEINKELKINFKKWLNLINEKFKIINKQKEIVDEDLKKLNKIN